MEGADAAPDADASADAFASAAGAIECSDVPAVEPTDRAQIDARLEQLRAAPATLIEGALPDNLEVYLDAVERDILARALERHRNNRTAAGASLGLSLRQMRYRMARLGVVVSGQDD